MKEQSAAAERYTNVTTLQTEFDIGALAGRFNDTRRLTEVLAGPLSAEDQTVQSMPDTSPTKWHRAHTTWFFETFLLAPNGSYEPYDPYFNYLFNSYYEAVGDRHPRPRRGMVTRPGAAEIGRYREYVDQATAELVQTPGALSAEKIATLVELGINHEQQHQELILMDSKHLLADNRFAPAYDQRDHTPASDPGSAEWVRFDGGITEIGFEARPGRSGFSFDNEGPCHRALVAPFELADRLITCGEWLEFMADSGYHQPKPWLSDGWYTAQGEGWNAPLYWEQDGDGQWLVHTLTGTRPVDPNEPVCHVSFYEADAFASWAGCRLPTEFEWEVAANSTTDLTTGSGSGALLDYRELDDDEIIAANSLHPSAAAPAGEPGRNGGGGLRQMFGDCWEWTGSPYRPYPGFRAPDGAIGEYNGKFMINTMVLRGGCAFTPRDHLRSTYRNFFHPHTRWHLSGLRLAKD